jgi:hypothetical protein
MPVYVSRKRLIFKNIWKWAKFLVWLPWFILTFPWQMRNAYRQVMSAISIPNDLDLNGWEANSGSRSSFARAVSPQKQNDDDNIQLKAK